MKHFCHLSLFCVCVRVAQPKSAEGSRWGLSNVHWMPFQQATFEISADNGHCHHYV